MAKQVQATSSLNSLLVILQCLGVFPSEKKKYSFLYSLILATFFMSLFIYAISLRDNEKEVTYIVNQIVFTCYTSVLITALATAHVKRKKLIEILKSLEKFDETILNKTNMNMNYRKNIMFSFISRIVASVLLCEYGLFELVTYPLASKVGLVIRWFIMYFSNLTMFFYHIFLASLSYLLYQRFCFINKSLEFLITTNKNVKNKKKEKNNNTVEKIKGIKVLNENLRSIANDICSNFAASIFVYCGTALLALVVNLNYLIVLIRNHSAIAGTESGVWKYLICISNGIFMHFIQLLLLVTGFYFTKIQASTH